MKYANIYETLKEFIDNAGILTLKTLISSLQMCDDVTEIRVKTSHFDSAKVDNVDKCNYKYLTGFLDVENGRLYNNTTLEIRVRTGNELRPVNIWFGKKDLLSKDKTYNVVDKTDEEKEKYYIRMSDEIYILYISDDEVAKKPKIDIEYFK